MTLNSFLKQSVVVIPSINGATLLERMLPSLRIPGANVLVLDQGSTDGTESVCRTRGVGLVQLGRPHTYTEACNIGAELARKRGCQYLFVSNNDIVFMTDVVRELLTELAADPDLGIAAPAQILIDEATGARMLANRVFWDLSSIKFEHDFADVGRNVRRIEADFCELTFAGIRLSTIEKIGFLDNEYGFYHEDADFGYRLRQTGYTCAYFPQSQIEHWTSATFSKKPTDMKKYYISKNKRIFEKKFLGSFVKHIDHRPHESNSENKVTRHLHTYLTHFGMTNDRCPELIFSHPGTRPFEYLYTVWETSKVPDQWLAYRDCYALTMTPSRWNEDVLNLAGFKNVHHVPLGVESDIFEPWGSRDRFYESKTFLWLAHNQHRKGLDIMLRAWVSFRRLRPHAQLILIGTEILKGLDRASDLSRRWKNFIVHEFIDLGVAVYETVKPVNDIDLACIYRSVDFTICSSRSEGFGFVVAESLACGTPPIFGDYGGTRDFSLPGAMTFEGAPTAADCSNKGFKPVGDWWEPNLDALVARLVEAYDMDDQTYRVLAAQGVRLIRTRFSWRSTCFSIRSALSTVATTQAPRRASQLTQTAIRSKLKLIISPYLPREIKALAHSVKSGLNGMQRHLKPLDRRRGILFIGYAEGELGLGHAFRANVAAAAQAGVSFAVYPFRVGIETRMREPFMSQRYDTAHAYDINIVEIAADQTPVVFRTLDPRITSRSYNILCTFWELPRAPEAWRPLLKDFHELWAPNAFVADAFREIFSGPITVIPPAVHTGNGTSVDRKAYGMEPDRFYFLFSFDYFSSPHRKNPLAVLRAFREAFGYRMDNVGLIIKSIGTVEHFPEMKSVFLKAAQLDPRIIVIDRSLKQNEMLGLISASDAYISLHRSEGFGMGMAEAMSFGRAVIGTNFSGNTCFLTSETGFPVPYTLREVGPGEYAWASGQVWAEPDIEAAAEIMRLVVERPDLAAERARAAKALIKAKYGPEAVGLQIKQRISEIEVRLSEEARPSAREMSGPGSLDVAV